MLVFVCQKSLQLRQEFAETGVTNDHHKISQQSFYFSALHRSSPDHAAPVVFLQIQQPINFGPKQTGPWSKSRIRRVRGLAVPRAHILADVASKEMLPDSLTIRFGD